MKIVTHWLFALVTLIIVSYIGWQELQVKQILKLKSFDLLFQSQPKEKSPDIGIVTIDEASIEKYGQWIHGIDVSLVIY